MQPPSTIGARRNVRRSPRIAWLAAAALVLFAVVLTLVLERTVFDHPSGSAQLRGSGIAATQIRHLARFRSVDLAGANVVSVHVGGEQRVVVRGDDTLLRFITTQVRNGRLVVGQARSFTTRSPTGVEVTIPKLDAVTLSGSGVLAVDGVRGHRFSVGVPGSGLLTASGTVDGLDVRLGGSGDVRLQEVNADDVTARLTGSGRLLVHANHRLDASLSGSGAIFYSGSPTKVTKSVSGSGAILEG